MGHYKLSTGAEPGPIRDARRRGKLPAQQTEPLRDGERARVFDANGAVTVSLTCPVGLTPFLVSGCERPPLGWYSDGFDVKSPATTARFAGEIAGCERGYRSVRYRRAPLTLEER